MNIFHIDDLFSDEEVKSLNQSIDYCKQNNTKEDLVLGRSLVIDLKIMDNIKEKITKICSELKGIDLSFTHAAYAEYSNIHGNPNLPPHFDGDISAIAIHYQLESNTSWDLGVDLQSYKMKDNSGLIFDANEYIHWRPHKNFKDDEYVKMIFFRFYDPKNIPDNSHLRYLNDNEIFDEVKKVRDSLT